MKRVKSVVVAAAIAVGGVSLIGTTPVHAASWSLSDLNTSGVDAMRLAQELAGAGVTVNSATFTGDNRSGGLFAGQGVADTIGITDGVVLSTGKIADIRGRTTNRARAESWGPPATPNSTRW